MKRSHTKKRKKSTKKTIAKEGGFVRLGSALFEPKEKRIIVFTEDMLLNQLRRDGPKIEASFDHLCENELIQLSKNVSEINGLIYSGLASANREKDELRIACAQLLMNASNSFCAAVAILRMGYVLQPGIIVRSLLEAISTSLHLIQKPLDLTAYQNHKLKSPDTIAAAKKVLPPFGKMYGHFSDNFAHIGELHKSITPIREYNEFHEALNVNLLNLRLSAWLLYVTVELIFNELISAPRYWHSIDEGYMYNPSETEKKMDEDLFSARSILTSELQITICTFSITGVSP